MPVSQVSISILRAHIHTHRHTDTQTHKHTNTQTNTQQPLHPISPTCLCFQGPQLTWQLHRLSPLDVCNLVGLVARDVKLQKQALVRERTFSTQRMLTPHISRVGQNRIYTPYMTVYTPYIKTSYIHRIYMVLANPTAYDRIYAVYKIPCIHRIYIYGSGQPYASYTMGMQHLSSPHPCLILSFYRALCTPHIPVPHISHHRAHRTICISPPASLILQDIHRTPPHISHHRARRTICISPPTSHSTGHSSHPTPHITPQGTQHHTWQMIFGQRALAQLAQAVVADSHARMSQYAPWVSARVKCTGAVMLCVTHTKRRLRGGLETFRLPRSASASSSLSSARRHVVLLIGAADLEEGAGKKHTGYASIEF